MKKFLICVLSFAICFISVFAFTNLKNDKVYAEELQENMYISLPLVYGDDEKNAQSCFPLVFYFDDNYEHLNVYFPNRQYYVYNGNIVYYVSKGFATFPLNNTSYSLSFNLSIAFYINNSIYLVPCNFEFSFPLGYAQSAFYKGAIMSSYYSNPYRVNDFYYYNTFNMAYNGVIPMGFSYDKLSMRIVCFADAIELPTASFTRYYDFSNIYNLIFDYDTVFNSGFNDGYNNALKTQKQVWIDYGYSQGLVDGGNNDYSFNGLLSALIDTPVKTVLSSLDFDIPILNVNIRGLLVTIFTLFIVVACIKLLLGGK